MPPSHFQTLLLPPHSLRPGNKHHVLLPQITDLVNATYHGHRSESESDLNDPRIPETIRGVFYGRRLINGAEGLLQELGDEGVAVVVVEFTSLLDHEGGGDDDDGDDVGMIGSGKVVAVACTKRWKGNVVDAFARSQIVDGEKKGLSSSETSTSNSSSLSSTGEGNMAGESRVLAGIRPGPTDHGFSEWDIELSPCAVVEDPVYRGQGLMIRCVERLKSYFLDLQARSLDRETGIQASSNSNGDVSAIKVQTPLRFWLTVLDGTGLIQYWQRRGFSMVGELKVAPKGIWGARRDFKLGILNMIIE